METPQFRSMQHVEHIEEYCIPEAQLQLEIDPLHDPCQVVFFVSIVGFSPYQPFNPELERKSSSPSESEEASETVLSWLRSGIEPRVVEKRLRRMQKWRWGAVVVDRRELAEELQARYELGDSETDFYWYAIPAGMVIHCRIIPRMWGGSGHP